KNFNNTKNELINKKQITINDNSFINDVKNDRCLVIKTSRHKLKDKIAEITNINVKSDQTLVGNFTYSHLGDNKKYLYKDVIRNIINCVDDSYLSYLALRQKGIKCNRQKLLHKNCKWNLFYRTNNRKIIKRKGH